MGFVVYIMKKINEYEFALLCYVTLMQGVATKTVEYMVEKAHMLEMGYSAIQVLHPTLRDYIKDYCKEWRYEFPVEAQEYISAAGDGNTEFLKNMKPK